jgi:hypothetical protein
MTTARIIRAAALIIAVSCSSFAAAAGRVVDRATMQKLSALRQGEALRLDDFPAGPSRNAAIQLRRVDVYAPDAHLYVIGAGGAKQELPRSRRIFLRGVSGDGATHVAMTLEPDATFVEGSGSSADGAFALKAQVDAKGTHTFSAQTLESTLPSPDAFEFRCGNDKVDLGLQSKAPSRDLGALLQRATTAPTPAPGSGGSPQVTYRGAVIAIDTDSEFMSRLFSNNTTSATNWIASMFNSMNTMYETDLTVQLLVGTTILRTSAANDPYTGLGQNTASNTADLNVFASYWRANEASVPRSFAILLSGAIASSGGSCSAAGIAWIDEYCQKGFSNGANTVGSYSVTKVCSSIAIDPNGIFDSRIVGHEIGHNFGAYHTHCTNTSNGTAPTGTNTIDQCYNGESGSGCYSGATSCPAGQTSGTIMSYCNISGCGTQNQLHFHPTQINDVLLPDIAGNTPSCLSASSDIIFQDKFGS